MRAEQAGRGLARERAVGRGVVAQLVEAGSSGLRAQEGGLPECATAAGAATRVEAGHRTAGRGGVVELRGGPAHCYLLMNRPSEAR